jgi:hypothetical protein
MVKNFTISNFFSIDSPVTLSFEPVEERRGEERKFYLTSDGLLKLAIIYGPNASGKSTIIKGFKALVELVKVPPLLRQMERINFFGESRPPAVVPFLFKREIDPVSRFELEFVVRDTEFRYSIAVKGGGEEGVEEIEEEKLEKREEGEWDLLFERNGDEVEWGEKLEGKLSKTDRELWWKATSKITPLLHSFKNLNLRAKEIEKVLYFFHRSYLSFPNRFDPLEEDVFKSVGMERILDKKLFLKVLQQADFEITDLEYVQQEVKGDPLKGLGKVLFYSVSEREREELKRAIARTGEIKFQHLNNYSLRWEFESEGTKQFAQHIGNFLYFRRDKENRISPFIVAIDEIESSLHPDLIQFLILFFLKNFNGQLLCTTHYRELLDAEWIPKDSIWFTEKREGATELFSLSDFEELKEQKSIRELYANGQLGGAPVVGRYWFEELEEELKGGERDEEEK